MIETLKEFAVKLSAVVDNKSFDQISDKMDETASSISDFAQTAIGVLTAGAFAVAIKETADRFNAISDAAARMGGVTAQELDRLGYIAGRTGSSAEAVTESFEELSKIIGEAANGVGGGKGFFEDYGFNARNVDGTVKTATQFFEELKVKTADWTEAQKSALLQQAGMDKTLVGMLSADTEAFAEEYDTRTRLLGINADEVGAMSADFNDHMGRMTRAFSDVMTAVVVRILPPITEAFKTVTRWVTYSGDTIVKVIDPFTTVIRTMIRIVNGALIGLGSIVDMFGGLPAYVALATVAWKAFNAVISASPLVRFITLATAVVSAIGLLIDDFKVAREGGKSFFQFWNQPWFESFFKAIDSALSFLSNLSKALFGSAEDAKAIRDAWDDFFSAIGHVWDGLAGGLEYAFEQFFPDAHKTIESFGQLVEEAATEAIDGLTDFFDRGFDALLDKIGGLATKAKEKLKGAMSSVADFFGFGTDESSGEVLGSGYAATAVSPSATTQSVTNNINNSVRQTFTVQKAEQAAYLSKATTPRFLGGAS